MQRLAMLLAQAPWAEHGDVADRLELTLCLNGVGRIDDAAYDADPAPWVATRSQPGHAPRAGILVRTGQGWALSSPRGDDEPVWDLDFTVLRPGELAILRQPDGTTLLFRIVSVERA